MVEAVNCVLACARHCFGVRVVMWAVCGSLVSAWQLGVRTGLPPHVRGWLSALSRLRVYGPRMLVGAAGHPAWAISIDVMHMCARADACAGIAGNVCTSGVGRVLGGVWRVPCTEPEGAKEVTILTDCRLTLSARLVNSGVERVLWA